MAFITRAEGVERSLAFFESTASDTATQLVTMVHGRSLAEELRRFQAENERLRTVARAVCAAWTSDDVFAVEEKGTALVDALGDLVELIEGDR